MTTINIQATDTTPKVLLNREENCFLIAGVSMPNDPIRFYDPIVNWFKEYQNDPIENAEFEIQLEYFNTASSKIILNLMKMIKDIGSGNKIIWVYDSSDDDIKEVGEDYQEMIGEDILIVKMINE